MSTVKIVVQSPDTLAIGTIDDIPITPGSKSIGFDNEQRGGGPTPVLNVGAGKRFSFRTQIVSSNRRVATMPVADVPSAAKLQTPAHGRIAFA